MTATVSVVKLEVRIAEGIAHVDYATDNKPALLCCSKEKINPEFGRITYDLCPAGCGAVKASVCGPKTSTTRNSGPRLGYADFAAPFTAPAPQWLQSAAADIQAILVDFLARCAPST